MGLRSQEQYALLTDYDDTTAYSQAFYTLFANIRFHREHEHEEGTGEQEVVPQVHSLLVAGVSAYKNQPTVAANLAIVAAQSGAETILIDADLRNSGLRQCFGLPQQHAGLSELLGEGEVTRERVAASLQPTFVPGLRVLSAGTISTQGTALLLSSRLLETVTSVRELLLTSKKPSGMLIFHSAPVLSGADASLIGALTDQTVLTVVLGQTTRAQGKLAQEQLQQARIRIAGVVMLHP